MTQFWLSMWLALGRLPFSLYRIIATFISALLAMVLYLFAFERRSVALTNLSMCFPNASLLRRHVWAIKHIYFYLRTFLDRAWLWSGDAGMLRKRVHFTNPDRLTALKAARSSIGSDGQASHAKSVILLAPHFLGLDAAWSRLCLELDMVTMYSNQKNPILNDLILKGRSIYGQPLLLSRQQGVRPLIGAIKKESRPLYYLPDMDFGEKDSVFVNFFGNKAATVTAVARLAKMLDADVVPVTTHYSSGRYWITLHPPLQNWLGVDETEATQNINHCIETWVKDNIEQYLWLHKRFKTRPSGESRIY